jgi:hypothetical protein
MIHPGCLLTFGDKNNIPTAINTTTQSQPVSSKSERQSYKLRTLESYQHGLPILPLSVEVCTPVSETGSAGALPAAAATLNSTKNKHLMRRAVAVCMVAVRWDFYE